MFNSGIGQNTVSGTLQFFGVTVATNLTSTQKVVVHAQKSMGSEYGGGSLNVDICYRAAGLSTSPLIPVGPGMSGIMAVRAQVLPVGLSAIISPGAGTWEVGLCGTGPGNSVWNWNGGSYVTAMVLNNA